MVIIATPLWWSQMAAPFQTFLFHYGPQMTGKNIGVIVSSASSGISGVVADAKRLIPDGKFIEPNLWIRSSQTSNAASLVSAWLTDINYSNLTASAPAASPDYSIEIVTSYGRVSAYGNFNTLSLYDISGSKVIETDTDHISTASLTPGTYIAQANNATHSASRKIYVR